MDKQNLNTASTYINNLLLSRGLLRDGNPIEFARPSKVEGGASTTMAKIINLVHDMILRRDRETDTLSDLSQNLQSLRTSAAEQTRTIARLETKASELDRQLALAVAHERAAKDNLRSAETRNRALRDEMGKLRLTVTHIRGQCANDIRKRDGEIQRLKRHLEGRRGREGNSSQPGVVVVTPGMAKFQKGSLLKHSEVDLQSSAASLKQETTLFLTELSKGLSNENNALVHLVKDTCMTLRALQGLPSDEKEAARATTDEGRGVLDDPNVDLTVQPSYERLAANIADALEHLRSILTNPSFVPLEEVEVREDEIVRLREGWEKMEARWREAVALMYGWKKRMMETGDTVNLEDLRRGLTLDRDTSFKSAPDTTDISIVEETTDESLVSETDSFVLPEEYQLSSRSGNKTRHGDTRNSKDEVGTDIFQAPKLLPSTSANKRRSLSPRKVSFRTAIPKTNNYVDTSEMIDDISFVYYDDITPSKGANRHGHSPSHKQKQAENSLTVQQKLDKARAGAEEARKPKQSTNVENISKLADSKSRPGRRRSTLSPEELEGLLELS